jgi:hypothetical protein
MNLNVQYCFHKSCPSLDESSLQNHITFFEVHFSIILSLKFRSQYCCWCWELSVVEGMLEINSCFYCTDYIVIHVWGYSMKFFQKEFCISSPFYFLRPVYFRHTEHTSVFWHTSSTHNTVDWQRSKNSVTESKCSIFKCPICFISDTAQLYCILPKAVIFMSSYLSRFPFLSLTVVSDKIILSSRALPVFYSDVWGQFLNDHHS